MYSGLSKEQRKMLKNKLEQETTCSIDQEN